MNETGDRYAVVLRRLDPDADTAWDATDVVACTYGTKRAAEDAASRHAANARAYVAPERWVVEDRHAD